MSDEVSTLVIDNGSRMIKAGFCCDYCPLSDFPSIVGRPKNRQQTLGGANKETFIVDETCVKTGVLILENPIELVLSTIVMIWKKSCITHFRMSFVLIQKNSMFFLQKC
jgi:hypothetical protein